MSSHVNALSPAGPTLTVAPGSTTTFTVDGTTDPDTSYTLQAVASDGSQVPITLLVDRPDLKLVGNPPAGYVQKPEEIKIVSNGGTVTIIPGLPPKFSWTAPS